jgi:hypothetical protein
MNNLYVKNVLGVGFLPCDDEPIKKVYQPKKDKKIKVVPSPPKLINMNQSIYYKPNSTVPLA